MEKVIELVVGLYASVKLEAVANWLAIGSFVISVFVAYNVRQIKTRFMFKIRMPQLHRRLKKLNKSIYVNIDDSPDKYQDIVTVLSDVQGDLMSLKVKSPFRIKSCTKKIIKNIQCYKKHRNTPVLWDIYEGLATLNAMVKNEIEDDNLR